MKVSKLWVFGVLAAILICAVPVFAEQMWVQGTEGRIEYMDRVTPANRTVLGWGLDFNQNPGLFNWIHYAVPTKSGLGWGARYIYIQCWTGSIDALINGVHIYNGGTRIKIVTYSPPKTGPQLLTIDMGAKTYFTRGLGVSINIGAGVESMSHRFWFTGVGANFYQ